MRSGFVALIGRPNAGKSTLINKLMNEKIAIVSAKPQTTRSEIRGILNTETAQIIFTDTPGIHKAAHRLESRMNKQAASVMMGVDLIYLLVDGSVPYSTGDAYVLRMVEQAELPVFLILNKIDRMSPQKVLANLQSWQERFDFAEYFPISALEDTDFSELIKATESYLPEGEAMYPTDMVTDNSLDFRIAEIIREKILLAADQEVPHASAVIIESKEYRQSNVRIQAVVMVEKQGQKGILIGRQGTMLKKIAAMARPEIEAIVGMKVYLDIFVRVEEEWRDRDSRITAYGYGITDE